MIFNKSKFESCLLIYYIDANKKLLDRAMKEGYITAKWTKFLVSGAPGTGKSSFLKLLYNEDPPPNHDSTSVVAAYEARKVEIIPATIDDNSEWTKTHHRSLTELIAQRVKNSIQPLKPTESMLVNQPLEESLDHPTDQIEETSDSDDPESSNTVEYDRIFDETSLPKPTVTQDIIDLLPQVKKSEELYKAHWIYGVDTGGQAAFLDIAPSLLRYHSVNILTHKLNEKLDDKAKFFFSVKGRLIGEPEERQITNLQLLEALFCSLSSIDFPKLRNIHVKHVQETSCLILGTFLDKILDSGESLKEKNDLLWSHLNKFNKHIIEPHPAGNEVIFSVNTLARDHSKLDVANKIHIKYASATLRQKFLFAGFYCC